MLNCDIVLLPCPQNFFDWITDTCKELYKTLIHPILPQCGEVGIVNISYFTDDKTEHKEAK